MAKELAEYVPLEGLSEKEQRKREKVGRRYRRLANGTTIGRTVLGGATSFGIMAGGAFLPQSFQYKTMGMAGAVGGLGAGDKVDGFFGRRAAKNGIPITDADKKLDPLHDKIYNHVIMGSLVVVELLDGNEVYAGLIGVSQVGTAIRDYKRTELRNNAIEGEDVGAGLLAKLKTGETNLTHTIAVSPIADTVAGQAVVVAGYYLGNVMGIESYRQARIAHEAAVASQTV